MITGAAIYYGIKNTYPNAQDTKSAFDAQYVPLADVQQMLRDLICECAGWRREDTCTACASVTVYDDGEDGLKIALREYCKKYNVEATYG